MKDVDTQVFTICVHLYSPALKEPTDVNFNLEAPLARRGRKHKLLGDMTEAQAAILREVRRRFAVQSILSSVRSVDGSTYEVAILGCTLPQAPDT